MKNEERWMDNYMALKRYVEEHHQLPDKKKEDNRRLLNWWKYNRKLVKAGSIAPERGELLDKLSKMRDVYVV